MIPHEPVDDLRLPGEAVCRACTVERGVPVPVGNCPAAVAWVAEMVPMPPLVRAGRVPVQRRRGA